MLFVALVLPLALLVAAQKRVPGEIPLPRTSPTSGREMYRAYCADCHGEQGKGNGPVASVLKVMPPDLTTLTKRHDGKFPYDRVYKTISGDVTAAAHGSREMPIWGPVFRDMAKGNKSEAKLRMKNLTSFVASLQEK
jgi:mono/diheme cytochrome c family protein